MTDQQIADKLAAVMGWNKWELKGYPSYWENVVGTMQITCDDWNPATDLNQAAQAAEKVARERNEPVNLIYWPDDNTWSAGWEGEDDTLGYVSTIGPADALSHAVVKAAGGEGCIR